MKGGRVVEYGTYQELLDRGVDFHAALDEGRGTTDRPPSRSAQPSPPAAAETAARAPPADTAALDAAPKSSTQSGTAALPPEQAAGMHRVRAEGGEAGEVSAAELDPAAEVEGDSRGHETRVEGCISAQAVHAEEGAAAAEQADRQALELAPLLAPTIAAGAVPEAAFGAVSDATALQGSDAEPRGWRGTDGKLAGARSASRKGRLVYVRFDALEVDGLTMQAVNHV